MCHVYTSIVKRWEIRRYRFENIQQVFLKIEISFISGKIIFVEVQLLRSLIGKKKILTKSMVLWGLAKLNSAA